MAILNVHGASLSLLYNMVSAAIKAVISLLYCSVKKTIQVPLVNAQ